MKLYGCFIGGDPPYEHQVEAPDFEHAVDYFCNDLNRLAVRYDADETWQSGFVREFVREL